MKALAYPFYYILKNNEHKKLAFIQIDFFVVVVFFGSSIYQLAEGCCVGD